ncbi:GntR family transcriptional regulator [Terrarubrum flagellatum]|uniref:GntR family transcriptional regulator n=1 Tax=Terrirubrum flagellatum TaxID=2895980 RepID=UPI0031454E19
MDLLPNQTSGEQRSLHVAPLPTLRQQVVERIREAIETGQFPAGARLIERDLCERMGVSRTSIREALRDLEAAGLIVTQPNKGPIVPIVTPEMAKAIYQVRTVLEGLAARLFARHATSAQIAALKDSVERLAAVYDNYTAAGFLSAKSEFYRILLEGAGNPVATEMLQGIHTRVSQLRATSLSNPSRAQASLAEIREFVAALAERNEEAAWHLCTHHIQNASDAALKMLETSTKNAAEMQPSQIQKPRKTAPKTAAR